MPKEVDDFIEVGGGEAWNGEGIIQGTYIHRAENVGPNNSMMYTLRTKDGDIGVWGSAMLDSKFDQIHLGDEVRVEFTGMSEKAGKFGKPYKTYKVSVRPGKRPDPGVADLKEDAGMEDDLGDSNVDINELLY